MNNRVIVLLGATGTMGRAVAQRMHTHDLLVLVARDHSSLHALHMELADHGKQVLIVTGDITIYEEREEIVSTIMQTCGRIDIVVDCVGIWFAGDIASHADDTIDDIVESNYTAHIQMMKHMITAMHVVGGGYIIALLPHDSHTMRKHAPIYNSAAQGFGMFLESLDDPHIAVTRLYVSSIASNFYAKSGQQPLDDDLLNPDAVAGLIEHIIAMYGVLTIERMDVSVPIVHHDVEDDDLFV